MTVRKFAEMYEGDTYDIRILLTEINEDVEKPQYFRYYLEKLDVICGDKIPAEWMDAEIQGWSFDEEEKTICLSVIK